MKIEARFRVVWLMFLLLCCFPASASELEAGVTRVDLSHEIEWLEDAKGRLTIDDMERSETRKQFRPWTNSGDFNVGFTPSVYWLKVSLRRAESAPSSWILEVPYASLDDLEFHSPGAPPVLTGNTRPLSTRPVFHRFHAFPVRIGTTTQVFYVRVASSYALSVPLIAWEERTFSSQNQKFFLLQALYYGGALTLLIYNFFLGVSLRDRRFIYYALTVSFLSLGVFSGNGLGRLFLWPAASAFDEISPLLFMALAAECGLTFSRTFLDLAFLQPRIDRIFAGLSWAFGVLAGLLGASLWLTLPRQALFELIALLTLPAGALIVAAACRSLAKGNRGARFFLVAWGILMIGAVVAALRMFDLVPTTTLTSYAVQIASSVEMLLLALALADVVHLERERRLEAQGLALTAQQQLLSTVSASEEKLKKEVAERTLDLQLLAATDPLTGAWNRRRFEEAATVEVARSQRYGAPVSLMLVDIDHFKMVNDNYGHQAGDRVLVELTRQLQGNLRAADVFARWGGEEFVVLLPHCPLDEAAKVAEKLRALLATCVVPVAGGVTASFGVAELARGETLETCLKRVDEALYRAKEEGRNRVEIAGDGPNGPETVSLKLMWRDSYACGNPDIDRQHRTLFDLANALLRAAVAETPSDRLLETMDALMSHVLEHFAHEEQVLRDRQSPALKSHAASHRALVTRAMELRSHAEEGSTSFSSLVEFLTRRLVAQHILKEDREVFQDLTNPAVFEAG